MISPLFKCFLAQSSKVRELLTYAEVAANPNWISAIKEEITTLQDNHTSVLVDLPPRKKTIGCKWVYHDKYNSNGSLEHYKDCLVARGFTQVEGDDFNGTFSPVVEMTTVRTLLTVVAAKSWGIFQMDVNNDFLQGDLFEEVYMDAPQGFTAGAYAGKVCKLVKSLYGLKQSSRQWNSKLTRALLRHRYIQSPANYSLFTKTRGTQQVLLLVYVDDLFITGLML